MFAPLHSSNHRHPSRRRRLRGLGDLNRRLKLLKQQIGQGTKILARSSFSFSCFSLSFYFGCFYTENPLFSLSKSKAHVVGKSIWDVHDATHWLDKVSKKNVRVETCTGSQASENRTSVFCVVPLHCCLFNSSVFIVFHGQFIGNPVFPLIHRTAQPYMKGALGCIPQVLGELII